MRQLLLLRHAKAAAAAADPGRRLSPAGRLAALAMRSVMRDLSLVPDLVLVSPSRRTLETLEALEPWDDTPLIETIDSLYLATAPRLLA
ncbi:MAG TPA: histidine phosphatase family protein, partial [Acetobacteraceae bacterium]